MAKAPGKAASGKTSAPSINIGISDKDRAAIAQGLSRLLADTYTRTSPPITSTGT